MTYEDRNGKNYVFMSSYDGIMLVQPYEPDREMTNQWDLRDVRGTYIIRELVRAARERRRGPLSGTTTIRFPRFTMFRRSLPTWSGCPR